MNVALVIPTRNGGELWKECVNSIINQDIEFCLISVIDSESSDETASYAAEITSDIRVISPSDFNHGKTRNEGFANVISKCNADIVVFLTQDAILNSYDSVSKIVKMFDDPTVGAVCGRQVGHFDANPLALHARLFNYAGNSSIKSKDDIPELGLKVAFMSNSFAAYRVDIYKKIGGFPSDTILAEDMFLASKMILSGYKVAYCAEAVVRHSHNYTPFEEFRRYFDTGVFHSCEPWIQECLGGASGEGFRFVKSEMKYLLRHAPSWIPRALFTTGCKLIGYKFGKIHGILPKSLCVKMSMHKSYWINKLF